MKRFFGMMPSSCIEISKEYKTQHGDIITIDAGKEGFTVTYADNSIEYKDINATTEENFNMAYKVAISHFELTEAKESECVCMCMED